MFRCWHPWRASACYHSVQQQGCHTWQPAAPSATATFRCMAAASSCADAAASLPGCATIRKAVARVLGLPNAACYKAGPAAQVECCRLLLQHKGWPDKWWPAALAAAEIICCISAGIPVVPPCRAVQPSTNRCGFPSASRLLPAAALWPKIACNAHKQQSREAKTVRHPGTGLQCTAQHMSKQTRSH